MRMRWYNQEVGGNSKWYYDDVPCELISLGVKKGEKTVTRPLTKQEHEDLLPSGEWVQPLFEGE